MPQSSNRVGNAPRFVFQILNLKSQIEQARPAGHVVKSLAVEDKSGERSGVSPPVQCWTAWISTADQPLGVVGHVR